MNKISLKAISGVALVILLVLGSAKFLAFGQNSEGPASGQNAQGRRIEGTWRVQITDRDCQTGAEIGTSPALHTYLAGGSMLSDPAVPPAILRTGHGVWEHAGAQSFTNTIVLFRFNPINSTYAGTVTITRNLELSEDSNELTSTDVAEAADPSGDITGTRCATTVGRRLE